MIYLLFAVFSLAHFNNEDQQVIDPANVFNHYDSDCEYIKEMQVTSHLNFKEPRGNCVNIIDSVFIGIIVSSGHGGAILFDNFESNASLTITQCTFTKCASEEGHGGAIECQSHSITIVYSCSYECTSHLSGQFIYLHKSSDSTAVINVTTVTNSNSEGDSPIDNLVSDSQLRQINISNCNSQDTRGTGSFKIASNKLVISECNIYKTNSYYTLTLNSYDSVNDIRRLNIVGNTANGALIFFNGHWTLCDTIFQQNSGKQATSSGSANLLFINCVFDTDLSDLPSNVRTDNCQVNVKTNTYKIGHLNTFLCAADISASPYVPPSDDDSDGDVWKNKGVISALAGGIVGALVLGVVIGAVSIWIAKRRKGDGMLSTNPLLSAQDK